MKRATLVTGCYFFPIFLSPFVSDIDSFNYYQFCLLQADVFSYGIILCEIIGRVPADPDELPRTNVCCMLYARVV